ncbi:MAG: hypothetical protein B7X48_14705 [Acidiphilium sp. 34-60-192]|nr:MAG: hypothetical protein B7X48_14705 [Acidiphilium sp. 34-60-192]
MLKAFLGRSCVARGAGHFYLRVSGGGLGFVHQRQRFNEGADGITGHHNRAAQLATLESTRLSERPKLGIAATYQVSDFTGPIEFVGIDCIHVATLLKCLKATVYLSAKTDK